MNERIVTMKVDIDTVRGLRERMKYIGLNNINITINNGQAQATLNDGDEAVLDMVREFMDDFIQADVSGGQ
jgi:hypothetical protein